MRQRCWSGRTCEMSPVQFLSIPFLLYSLACAEPTSHTHTDRFWPPICHTTCFRERKCLLGSRSYCSLFWGQIPKKPSLGLWIDIFMPNGQNIKTCILIKLLHQFQPNFAPLQRPSNTLRGPNTCKTNPICRTAAILEKSKNSHIPATVWPIGTKFGIIMHMGPVKQPGGYNFKLLKIQDNELPPFWKIKKSDISPERLDWSA